MLLTHIIPSDNSQCQGGRIFLPSSADGSCTRVADVKVLFLTWFTYICIKQHADSGRVSSSIAIPIAQGIHRVWVDPHPTLQKKQLSRHFLWFASLVLTHTHIGHGQDYMRRLSPGFVASQAKARV